MTSPLLTRIEASRGRPCAVRVRIHVKPRASRSRVVGVREDALQIAVAAPPVDGEANAEACALIARTFGVAKSNANVVVGESSRNKIIEIAGVEIADAWRIIGALDVKPGSP